MSVLLEVVEWASGLSGWVQDGLRRIVQQAQLTDVDIAELAELCKKAHGLSESQVVPTPISEMDVPAASAGEDLALVSLKHVGDVNALAPGESLTFSPTGLTVVYGDNGAGKSGYARILKRSCRARGSGDPVLTNALSDAPGGTPRAEVTVRLGEDTTTYTWQDERPCAPELGAVSVFDSAAAQVYVTDKTEVAFRPFGLDVLDKLADASGRVRAILERERDTLARQTPSWPTLAGGTEAARLLGSLTALTKRELIDRVAGLTEIEAKEMARLEQTLATARADDPIKRATEIRARSARFRKLSKRLEHVASQLGGHAISALAQARDEAVMYEKASAAARADFAGQAILPDTGAGAWKKLWEAARHYAEHVAYAGVSFPNTGQGARCVLCQQELGDEARARLRGFENFVAGEVQTKAAQAKQSLDTLSANLQQLEIDEEADLLQEVEASSADLGKTVRAFLTEAVTYRTNAVGVLATGNESLPASGLDAPTHGLESLATDLDNSATEMAAAADPAKRKAAEDRLVELGARAKLAAIKVDIIADVDRKARLNAYEKCLKETATTAISKKSTELTTKHVSQSLAAEFSKELAKLGWTRPELVLKAVGSQRGALLHQIQLKHATRAQLPKIVSEGEARCLALAAFLAELHTAATAGPIVFDDPVCSLDHRWRARVARRLVEAAKTRQVIVFTHEVVFLFELTAAAEKERVPIYHQTVHRRPGTTGHVAATLPWGALPVSKRIGWLRNELQNADKAHRTTGEEAYEPLATRLYGRLRQTWERAIEEVLFNGVVERFRDSVKTQQLKAVTDITAADFAAVDAGMTKCSKWEGGHDQAAAMNEPVPAPDELGLDIDNVDWTGPVLVDRFVTLPALPRGQQPHTSLD